MEILNVLKVFGYIFLLMLALLLLKGLSTFEYSLRDKTVTYNDVLVEEFDSVGKGLLGVFKKDKVKDKPSHLTLNLGEHDSAIRIIPIYEEQVVAQDSGFLELRYSAEANRYLRAKLAWQDKTGTNHVINQIDQAQTSNIIEKSGLISLDQFSKLIIELDKEAQQEAIARDSLSADKPIHLGNIYVDYFKIVSVVKQKPTF